MDTTTYVNYDENPIDVTLGDHTYIKATPKKRKKNITAEERENAFCEESVNELKEIRKELQILNQNMNEMNTTFKQLVKILEEKM